MEILANLSALGLSETDFEKATTEPEIIKKIHDKLDAYFKEDTHRWPYGEVPEFIVKDYISGRPWINAILFTIRDWNFELTTTWSPSKEPDQRLYHMVIADTVSEPTARLQDEQYLAIAHNPLKWDIFQINPKGKDS